MTIMTQGNSEGSRRCDGSCHAAKRPKCTCICGGRYHGVGNSARARELLTADVLGPDWQAQQAAADAKGLNYLAVAAAAFRKARTAQGV